MAIDVSGPLVGCTAAVALCSVTIGLGAKYGSPTPGLCVFCLALAASCLCADAALHLLADAAAGFSTVSDGMPLFGSCLLLGLYSTYFFEWIVHGLDGGSHPDHDVAIDPCAAQPFKDDIILPKSGLTNIPLTSYAVGTILHNFVDGLAIAAAFRGGLKGGSLACIGVVAHEIPTQITGYLLFVKAGNSTMASFLKMAALSTSVYPGTIAGIIGFPPAWGPAIATIAGGNFISLSFAMLFPEIMASVGKDHTLRKHVLFGLVLGSALPITLEVLH